MNTSSETQKKNVVAREGSDNGGLILMINLFYRQGHPTRILFKTT